MSEGGRRTNRKHFQSIRELDDLRISQLDYKNQTTSLQCWGDIRLTAFVITHVSLYQAPCRL
jgi:hypothetical protein